MKLARRTEKLRSFIAMDVLEKVQGMAQLGHDVISFSVGEPDFPPPRAVKEAAIKALKGDFTKYTHSLGMPALREAICAHYRRRYGVKLYPDQILVTAGTSPAMLLLFNALLNRGDEVVLSDPHYPCYANFLRFAEARPVFVKVREEDGFQFRPEAVRKKLGKKTKAVLINSPANPTGCPLPSSVMKSLAKTGKYLISDEIYHGLTYSGEERSILEFTDRAFVLNGFSKAYAMTGFRLGYLIFPRVFSKIFQNMAQNFFISASSFVQAAGIAALERAEADQKRMRKIFDERRKAMLAGVKSLGFGVANDPTGAFYVFANAKHYTKDSYRFAFDLLEKAKVGVTPGIDFGPSGEGYIRFSYATDLKKIHEGLARIGEYLRQRRLI
ncbi:MAG: pyridoxal phosphate-dependent aminotransferase [Deltaproteobacteria bacterium]|nr:pyridoxal phosphate-dependent aminotransferase [Deltaproteobacteria bacterium]